MTKNSRIVAPVVTTDSERIVLCARRIEALAEGLESRYLDREAWLVSVLSRLECIEHDLTWTRFGKLGDAS